MKNNLSKGKNLHINNFNPQNFDLQKEFSPQHKDSSAESKRQKEKSTKGLEKYRSNSFVSKLNFYIKKYHFSEKELLMIKKR